MRYLMKAIIISLLIVCSVVSTYSQNITNVSNSKGLQFAEQFSNLPYFKTGTQTYQFSSTDPAEDQFKDFGHWLYTDTDSSSVLADIDGPGCIYRIWSTGNNGDSDRIKVYIDGNKKASIDQTFNQFHNYPPLRQKPQVGSEGEGKYLAWWSYMPIPFEKSCKIVRQGNFRPFYNITYHTYTSPKNVKSWNGKEDYKRIEQMWNHPEKDAKSVEGNKIVASLVKLQSKQNKTILQQMGKGSIASIKIDNYLKDKGLRIKIYWDGETIPSVDAPVKWFFGSVDNGGDLKALGIGTVNSNGYCYFPMPFWKDAKIVIDNQSDVSTDSMKIEIQYNPKIYNETECGYFHAKANESDKPINKYTCLKTTGRGQVIGMAKRMPKGGHACEGDEIFYIDNRCYPDIYGTGEEDYNNNAWWTNSYNSYPTHGCIGNDCYYRIHYPDMIIYEQALDMEFEAWEPFYVASIVWYYQKDKPSLKLTDSLDIYNPASEKMHSYILTNETWSGNKKGVYPGKQIYTDSISDDGRAFIGYSQFNVNIDPANKGVRLRLRTDNGEIQVAKIWIDKIPVNERLWKVCKNKFLALWVDADFEIPEHYTGGKKSLQIKVEYSPESRKQWTEFDYKVFSYVY